MPAHVERKPWAGIFDFLTWAPSWTFWRETWYPFFLTETLCVRVPVAYMCCDVLHHNACSVKQQYTSKKSGIFKIVWMMTCRRGPLPRVWLRSCFQFFAGPVHKFAQFRLTS